MEPGTDVLRKAAPEWNLAGDKHLLQVLEQMHQKIVSKCQEVYSKLDEMANKLDNASVNMQNVNNKFMALSNSQFIESRVYDDDILSEEDSVKKAAVPTEQESEVSKIKHSLKTFEEMHEAVRILDSDSSDEEEDIRTILKLKAVYSDRPLPYIIGSTEWRSKWHVGLVPSESESDSSAEFSKSQAPREQYSESESEEERAEETSHEPAEHRGNAYTYVSPSSSEPASPARPADVAAQIAKRLAAQQPPVEPETPEMPVPETVPRKVYRADQPPATIFSEEPPPLDDTVDDYSDGYSDDDDIFAELHKKPVSRQRKRPNVAGDPFVDQLFGDDKAEDLQTENKFQVSSSKAKDSSLYNDELSSHLRTQNEVMENKSQPEQQERTAKKPIGGMSLFGSSQGAESIGAAILKRNQRKSSSDLESNDVEENKQSTNVNKSLASTNKIIEDLFSKPTPNKKETGKVTSQVEVQDQEKPSKPKVDLFSDNIFDDIDDIFTADIVTKPKQSHQKSIFDEDELFADIPTKANASEKKKSLFDSDDELFKEDSVEGPNINKNMQAPTSKEVDISKPNESSKKPILDKSIFSDDSDDIFSSNNNTPRSQFQVKPITDAYNTPSNEDDKKTINVQIVNIKKDEIEQESKIHQTESQNKISSEPKLKVNSGPQKQFESPQLFGEDEIDDLFINKSKQTELTRDMLKDDIFAEDTDEKSFNERSLEKLGITPVSEGTLRIKLNEESEIKNDKLHDKTLTDENKDIEENRITATEPLPTKMTPPYSVVLESSNVNIGNYTITDSDDRNFITEPISSAVKSENSHNEIDDIFSDIPPAFEKPSEPKKSKNVNALFDDDSDDENLFFKKNEVHEDKPEAMYNDDRFRIFHDEPPDIDFSQKSNNIDNLFSSTIIPQNIENAQSSSHKHDENDIHFPVLVEAEKTKTIKNEVIENTSLDISKALETDNVVSGSNKSDYNKNTSKKDEATNLSPKKDTVDVETEKKSIGKLKPMNININVNTLLPGASPTKQKTKDQTDGSSYSTKSNEEINKYSSQKAESVMVKSVSFDGNPGSEVLDNKFSKERAKIQMKRRPSSRRARLEAVRKSGISFGEDSTDNSSSLDESKPQNDDCTIYNNEFESKEEENNQLTHDSMYYKEVDIEERDVTVNKNIDDVQNIVNTETKTVYILHDEDIFTDSPVTHILNNKKSLTILDDDDELFKNPSVSVINNDNSVPEKEIESIPDKDRADPSVSVINIGESITKKEIENIQDKDKQETNKSSANHKKDTSIKPKTSIFDDLSDDELFGGKESSGARSGVSVINQKEKTAPLESKKVIKTVTTGNLFGDDSDDDLFRTAKTSEIKTTKPKEAPTTITEPVTDDPLSLFDDS